MPDLVVKLTFCTKGKKEKRKNNDEKTQTEAILALSDQKENKCTTNAIKISKNPTNYFSPRRFRKLTKKNEANGKD